jgi:hypothetical protein
MRQITPRLNEKKKHTTEAAHEAESLAGRS